MGLALIQCDLCASEKGHLAPEIEMHRGKMGYREKMTIYKPRNPKDGRQTS